MPLSFKGVAHGPGVAHGRSSNKADLTSAEISTTNLGSAETPLLVEHDYDQRCGEVMASWRGPNGELRVQGLVRDDAVAESVRRGELRGLSLGSSVLMAPNGDRLYCAQDELSICEEPKRAGCYIDEINGQRVKSNHTFSKTNTGVSIETHNAMKNENDKLREAVAIMKAKTEIYDAQKREALVGMKGDVSELLEELSSDASFSPYKQEIAPMQRWSTEMEKTESQLDTNLSIARVISCASAKMKRVRDEASKSTELASLLAKANESLELSQQENATSKKRILELEELVSERTKTVETFQKEMAMNNLISEKEDFSKRSSRETINSAGQVAVAASSSASSAVASRFDPNAALMNFITSGNSNLAGSSRIGQSTTGHQFLGSTGGPSNDGIAEALRGF